MLSDVCSHPSFQNEGCNACNAASQHPQGPQPGALDRDGFLQQLAHLSLNPLLEVYLNTVVSLFSFYKFINFIYLFFWLRWVFVVVRGLFSGCGQRGLLLRWLLLLRSTGSRCRLQQLWHAGSVVMACRLQSTGSVVVVHGLSCSVAYGIFPDQGSNPRPLHWQEDS